MHIAPEILQNQMVLHPHEIKKRVQQLPYAERTTANQSAAHMLAKVPKTRCECF